MFFLCVSGVIPGLESANASLGGMGSYAHAPAHSTHTERAAVIGVIVRMMHSVHLSMEHVYVLQVCN
jgi:phosphoribosylamine-glycine ligase